jgi:hypothetical protein
MKRIILFVAGGNESKPVFAGGGVDLIPGSVVPGAWYR